MLSWGRCPGHGGRAEEEAPPTAQRNKEGQRHFLKRKDLTEVFIHIFHVLRGTGIAAEDNVHMVLAPLLIVEGISKHYFTQFLVDVMKKK